MSLIGTQSKRLSRLRKHTAAGLERLLQQRQERLKRMRWLNAPAVLIRNELALVSEAEEVLSERTERN